MSLTLTDTPEGSRGGSVPLLTLVLGYDDLLADVATTFRLDRLPLPLVIGRASDASPASARGGVGLRVPDRWMSSKQARLERRGAAIHLVDAGSRNGSLVNGARVTDHELADGDLVELGHTLFCFRLVDESSAALLASDEDLRVGAIRTFSPDMATVLRDLGRIAPGTSSVLILAETGAGKESLAAAVHARSGRPGAWVPVDAGAIPESLFESTMFGHRKGAFTGAAEARTGEIVRADRGTLFLDEIGNLAPASQAKLLRTIEECRVTPVGATEAVRVNVRWVSATNRDLFAPGDTFRQDLLRRLAGHVARIPPLRRRREDLGVLAAACLREAGVERASITAEAARILFAGDLPGNVRQLREALKSAVLLAGGTRIESHHLPSHDRDAPPAPVPVGDATPDKASAMPERDALTAALSATRGNVVRAAKLLSTHPRQVYRWMDRYGLSIDDYRG